MNSKTSAAGQGPIDPQKRAAKTEEANVWNAWR